MFSSLLFSFNNFYVRIVATVQVFAVGWYDIVYMGQFLNLICLL